MCSGITKLLLRSSNKSRDASQRSHTLNMPAKFVMNFLSWNPLARLGRNSLAPRSSIKAPLGHLTLKTRRPPPLQGGKRPPNAHSSSFCCRRPDTGSELCEGEACMGRNTLKSMEPEKQRVKASNLSAESGFDVDEIGSIYYVGGFCRHA